MKALILAAGKGKRFGNYLENKNKCMIEIAGRPVIEYTLELAVNVHAEEIIVVVGFQAEQIMNRFGGKYKDIKIVYVTQPEQRGLVNAIECAKPAIGNDDFMLFLGDEIMTNTQHLKMLETFQRLDLFGICGVVIVNDLNLIRKTYTILQNETNNEIIKLVEKPVEVFNNLQGTGNCIFRNELLNFIDITPVNPVRNEKELPELIQCAIDHGKRVHSFIIGDRYVNINVTEDVYMAENFHTTVKTL